MTNDDFDLAIKKYEAGDDGPLESLFRKVAGEVIERVDTGDRLGPGFVGDVVDVLWEKLERYSGLTGRVAFFSTVACCFVKQHIHRLKSIRRTKY